MCRPSVKMFLHYHPCDPFLFWEFFQQSLFLFWNFQLMYLWIMFVDDRCKEKLIHPLCNLFEWLMTSIKISVRILLCLCAVKNCHLLGTFSLKNTLNCVYIQFHVAEQSTLYKYILLPNHFTCKLQFTGE